MLLAYALVAALGAALGVALVEPPAREVREAGVRSLGQVSTRSPVSLTFHARGQTPTIRYRGRTAEQWAARYRRRTRDYQTARRALHQSMRYPVYGLHWLERAFMCIHSFEGSWTDGGAPFYGGLQMDEQFQRTYGDWALQAFGTADRWPVSVQLAVAIRAKVSGRGFYPWPNTARACGLL